MLDTFAAEASRSHGEVHVTSRVVGFKKIKFYTNENVGAGELDLPEQEMHTTAYWLTIPSAVLGSLPYAADDRRDGVVGLSFAMRQVAQLLLMCDRQDIGISIGSGEHGDDPDLSRPGARFNSAHGIPATLPDEPRIFVYDNYPGGIGFSEPLFRMHDDLLGRTRELIAACECEHGCPTCVGPVGNTGPMAKAVALRILESIPVGPRCARRRDSGRRRGSVLVSSLAERLRAIVPASASAQAGTAVECASIECRRPPRR